MGIVSPMMELRFLQVDGGGKVLQYRYKYPNRCDAINSYPPEEWHWSEWIVVPIVISNAADIVTPPEADSSLPK